MSGGPVSGAPWTGTLSLVGGAGIASAARRNVDPNDPANCTGIIVPTVLQMAADVLSYWTSMTCLYDRYWTAEPGKVTLPVCMFHVKKCTPVRAVETSKKRVILYEPEKDKRLTAKEASDQMREGVMRTIVDNAVKQPTTYNMEVIVPFQPIGRYVTEGVKTVSDVIVALTDLFGRSAPTGKLADDWWHYTADWWEGVFSSVFSLLNTARTAAEFAGKLPGMDGVSYINMNSLEAMAESCRTLCMKMWTGYDYKYVMITNMTYDKNPTEDDVFRAAFTLTEMPVLAVTRPESLESAAIKRNWAVTAVSAVQGALVSPLIALTGVKTAAGDGQSGIGMIKSTLGVQG